MPFSIRKKKLISSLWETAIDALLPPRCVATGDIVDNPGMLSPQFWLELQFIETPFCKTCGMPFSFDIANDALCAACMEHPPLFNQSRSAVIYNDASQKLILSFKYGDKLHIVRTFMPWLKRAGKEMLEKIDIIMPVPLHPRRLRERRFNQSAILAQALAKDLNKKYIPDALIRTRHTIQQKGLTINERYNNVHGAFDIHKKNTTILQGKNILLIDDVFTTGATLNECTRILKKEKASSVNVLTIARVTKDEF